MGDDPCAVSSPVMNVELQFTGTVTKDKPGKWKVRTGNVGGAQGVVRRPLLKQHMRGKKTFKEHS